MQRKWWKESVVYQIYPRSFYDSNGDGIGDLGGIIQKLDYLKTLGVDILWLNPIYASPDIDNGYDISDYQAVHPQYGTMADLECLIEGIHQRGMRIIMDLVINHTSDQHPWFIESCKSRDNPYREYYIWRDGKDGHTPNNWGAHFTKSAWTFDSHTGQYYLNTFSAQQPDLNWENPTLRTELHRMIQWWLEKGIDGFRLDAISFISKAPGFPDNATGDSVAAESYVFSLENMMNGPQYHQYLRELNREVLRKFDIVTVGECIGLTVESAIDVSAPERGELNMPFLFEHSDYYLNFGKDPQKLKEILTRWQVGMHGKGWMGMAFDSHDLPRVVSLFGDDTHYREASAKLFATLLLTLEGTPFIYQGEEIGMTNVAFERIEDYDDIHTINLYHELVDERGQDPAQAMSVIHTRSRDNARTPMQWNASPQAGFTTGRPWLKVNANYPSINVAQALSDSSSIFHYFQQLIQLRKNNPALIYGSFDSILPEHEQVYAYTRTLEPVRLMVILNLSAQAVSFELPEDNPRSSLDLLIGNYPVDPAEDGRYFSLQPYEGGVYQL
jgi:oligo-1,6-glucosidase